MADHVNHHFVPQFYFRLFSDDGRTIGALLKRDGRTIVGGSIKGQCARRNFYGSKEVESWFCKLEGQHSSAIRALLAAASDPESPCLTNEQWSRFLEAIAFQRGRTEFELEKSSAAICDWAIEAFKTYLKSSQDIARADEMIAHINAGHFKISEDPVSAINRHVAISLSSALGLSDLCLCVLRNRTDYPFLFGDAPVVFYNSYCRNVRNRGVLGIQSPGLQVFFPLNPWTVAFLFDETKYVVPFGEHLQFDVYERSDVSQINALQLHHSLNAVYFGRARHRQYVHDLWQSHRTSTCIVRDKLVVGADLLVDGARPDGQVLHYFAPQIDFSLNLTFVTCEPIAQADYVYVPRSPELREEMNRRAEAWNL